jgi:hypothetical protein
MGNFLMAYTEQTKLVGNIANTQTVQNVSSQSVQDTTQFEGQSQIELLAQILLELKILNQQIYELPRLRAMGLPAQDEPQTLRTEQSLFNI